MEGGGGMAEAPPPHPPEEQIRPGYYQSILGHESCMHGQTMYQ